MPDKRRSKSGQGGLVIESRPKAGSRCDVKNQLKVPWIWPAPPPLSSQPYKKLNRTPAKWEIASTAASHSLSHPSP